MIKWRLTLSHLNARNTQRPDISLLDDLQATIIYSSVIALFFNDFRSHPERSTNHSVSLHHCILELYTHTKISYSSFTECNWKIPNFAPPFSVNNTLPALISYMTSAVHWLSAYPVNLLCTMNVVQSQHHMGNDMGNFFFRQCGVTLLDHICQRTSSTIFHQNL